MSMEIDINEHRKRNATVHDTVAFHLGYLSFFFPLDHLLIEFARTPATTERIKSISIDTSFRR